MDLLLTRAWWEDQCRFVDPRKDLVAQAQVCVDRWDEAITVSVNLNPFSFNLPQQFIPHICRERCYRTSNFNFRGNTTFKSFRCVHSVENLFSFINVLICAQKQSKNAINIENKVNFFFWNSEIYKNNRSIKGLSRRKDWESFVRTITYVLLIKHVLHFMFHRSNNFHSKWQIVQCF